MTYINEPLNQNSIKTGWECPKCGSVMAPDMPYCIFCIQSKSKETKLKSNCDSNFNSEE